ncbi:MAG TPA: hypothetical protein VFD40_00675 [Candidatus Paceibacterota bacterium]|nr:hypothetical protein [Candidatus Paceibacterota bacterium]
MFNILPPLLIILGITGLIFIFNNQKEEKDGEIREEKEVINEKEKFLGKFRGIFNKENYQKTGNKLTLFVEKFLIRSRIIILRIDRTIFKNLTSIRKRKNGNTEDKENEIIKSFNEGKLIEDDIDFSHILDIKEEEKKLLKGLENNSKNIAILKNLARIYLWQEDSSSARWVLLEAYRLDKDDNIVQGLLIELYGKKGGE